MTRLNKYLAAAGFGSRRSCEALITEGKVTINGKPVTQLATVVGPNDAVAVNGSRCRSEKPLYLLFNKPAGVVCSRDPQGRRKTVFDFLPPDAPRLFTIGRLDLNSEGLLLLTNDGELAQRLTHPRYKMPKIYHVELNQDYDFALVPRLTKGMTIETGFGKMDAVFKLGRRRLKVILTQGLKRQIRLMFIKQGYRVEKLERVQIASIQMQGLRPGEWRPLDQKEIKLLMGEKTA